MRGRKVPPYSGSLSGTPTSSRLVLLSYFLLSSFGSSRTHNAAAVMDFMTWMTTPTAQNLWTATSSGTVIPANPLAKSPDTPLVTKGKAMLAAAGELTQFFNRDSTDALQNTANTALVDYIQNPGKLNSILATWQSQAEQVWKSS